MVKKYLSFILSTGLIFFFFQAEDGIRDTSVTGVQTCALPISHHGGVERGQVRLPQLPRRNLGTKGVRRHAGAPRAPVEKGLMGATIQPDRILHDLSELWVSLGKQNGDESTGVLRACAMTLIVVAEAQED